MALMSMLYKTYESNAASAGEEDENGITLSVVAHMVASPQLEMTITSDGDFVSAKELEKKGPKILIPVTEYSSSRTSKSHPHALCDTLSYIAGDFRRYIGENEETNEKKREKYMEKTIEKNTEYMEALEKWADDETYSHIKVRAIYKYLSKNETINDLVNAGIVKLENGMFDSGKISGKPYDASLVCFRVIVPNDDASVSSAVWKDKSLLDCYTSYYSSKKDSRKDICYISGKEGPVSTMHPKGIVAANYEAKFVFSNYSDFTFTGRFTNSAEAYAVGYESSQKIHSALTYLVAKQGLFVGKRVYVCWNPQGRKVNGFAVDSGIFDKDDIIPDTQQEYRQFLKNTIAGWKNELNDSDDIVITALDAATTGRLSAVYYSELKASDFLERINYWYESCTWYYTVFDENKKPALKVKYPTLKEIARFAYGTERAEFIDLDDKILKEQVQRLVSCMIDGRKIPRDMLHAIAEKASTPTAYGKRYNWEKVLSTACALTAKRYNDDHKSTGDEYSMELDNENNDRSYLFGRLLAVLEKVERNAFDAGESREPNAIRLMSAYVNHPVTVWKNIDQILIPYYQKLRPGSRKFYKDLIGEITSRFKAEDMPNLNRKLGDNYLLGYYLQRKSLNTRREDKKEEELQ